MQCGGRRAPKQSIVCAAQVHAQAAGLLTRQTALVRLILPCRTPRQQVRYANVLTVRILFPAIILMDFCISSASSYRRFPAVFLNDLHISSAGYNSGVYVVKWYTLICLSITARNFLSALDLWIAALSRNITTCRTFRIHASESR